MTEGVCRLLLAIADTSVGRDFVLWSSPCSFGSCACRASERLGFMPLQLSRIFFPDANKKQAGIMPGAIQRAMQLPAHLQSRLDPATSHVLSSGRAEKEFVKIIYQLAGKKVSFLAADRVWAQGLLASENAIAPGALQCSRDDGSPMADDDMPRMCGFVQFLQAAEMAATALEESSAASPSGLSDFEAGAMLRCKLLMIKVQHDQAFSLAKKTLRAFPGSSYLQYVCTVCPKSMEERLQWCRRVAADFQVARHSYIYLNAVHYAAVTALDLTFQSWQSVFDRRAVPTPAATEAHLKEALRHCELFMDDAPMDARQLSEAVGLRALCVVLQAIGHAGGQGAAGDHLDSGTGGE